MIDFYFNDTQKLCIALTYLQLDYSILENINMASINWDKFLEYGKEHKVLGFFKYHLSSKKLVRKIRIPTQILELIFRNQVDTVLHYDRHAKEILDIINANSIPYGVLKGPALRSNIYKSFPNVRGSYDLDILVYEKDAAILYQLLKEKGYEIGYRYVENSLEWEKAFVNLVQHYAPLVKDHFCVEIHHRLHQSFISEKPNANIIVQDCDTVIGSFGEMKIPNKYDLLLSICYHLYYHHCFESEYYLKNHVDIANYLLYYSDNFDWEIFLQRVIKHNIRLSVSYALYFTNIIYFDILGFYIIPPAKLETIFPIDFMKEKDAVKIRFLLENTTYGYWDNSYKERLFLGKVTNERNTAFFIYLKNIEEVWTKKLNTLDIHGIHVQPEGHFM